MPELPNAKRKRYVDAGLTPYDANVIVEQQDMSKFFDELLQMGADAKTASNFLMGEIAAYTKEEKLSVWDTKLTPKKLFELLELLKKGTISNNIAKNIVITLMKEETTAAEIVEKQGLSVISDEGAIKDLVNKIVEANPNQVAAYKGGKQQLFGFFVGQVMKETKGRANPQVVNNLLRDVLDN